MKVFQYMLGTPGSGHDDEVVWWVAAATQAEVEAILGATVIEIDVRPDEPGVDFVLPADAVELRVRYEAIDEERS